MRALILSLLLIAILALLLHDNPSPDEVHVVASRATTEITAWPVDTPPSLPENFDQLVHPQVRARRTAPKRRTTWAGNLWDRLAACESGGDWHLNTGNGYFGGLQEDMTFWRSYAPHAFDKDGNDLGLVAARPDLASREDQIAAAEKARRQRGFRPWPTCAPRLGLR